MNQTSYKYLLRTLLLLAALGTLVSLDLTRNHMLSSSSDAPCDITPSVSCSLVNTSIYSELLSVPVSLFGVFWFLTLAALAFAALLKKENPVIISALWWWNVLGILFVGYLIVAEFLLHALCPLCTIVHVIIVISLSLSYLLYRTLPSKPSLNTILQKLKFWVMLSLVPHVLAFFAFNYYP